MQLKGFISKVLSTLGSKHDPYSSFQVPIYANGAFDFETAEDMELAFTGKVAAHMYSRSSNPTCENLELRVKAVTGAMGVVALSSGMAAISTTFITLCEAGDNIILSNLVFGNTWSLFASTFASFGIETRFVDLKDTAEIEKAIDSKTRALFFETITNPQCEVVDISTLSTITKKHSILLICDSTLTPPNIFKAKECGVDIELISSSKIISGGGTSIGGLILDYATYNWSNIPKLKDFYQKFGPMAFFAKLKKEIFRNIGTCMSPFNAYMQSLGMESLPLRFERSSNNALKIATFLEIHPAVSSVNFPGLESSPYNLISLKQFGSIPTSVLSFNLKDREHCFTFLNKLEFISIATNLMENRTLILHPASSIYSEYSEERRAAMQVPDTLIRISVGIEDIEDLLTDLTNALL
jgi:O-acetylhomoserine (thiol)-lyase